MTSSKVINGPIFLSPVLASCLERQWIDPNCVPHLFLAPRDSKFWPDWTPFTLPTITCPHIALCISILLRRIYFMVYLFIFTAPCRSWKKDKISFAEKEKMAEFEAEKAANELKPKEYDCRRRKLVQPTSHLQLRGFMARASSSGSLSVPQGCPCWRQAVGGSSQGVPSTKQTACWDSVEFDEWLPWLYTLGWLHWHRLSRR